QAVDGRGERLVDILVLEDLQRDALGGQRVGEAVEYELARDVDPRGVRTHDALERELGQGVEDDARGGVVVVGDDRLALLVTGTEQQLVADKTGVAIEDRLAGDVNTGHGSGR